MPARRGPLTRGSERGRGIARALMREAEVARLTHGTSYATIARALRLSPGAVARIMRGDSPSVSILRAAQVLEAVGMEMSARAFPAGLPVRDGAQIVLLARFRRRISSELAWSEEVPVVELGIAGSIDHRAWDVGIDGPGVCVRVDAETRIGDLQALERRVALKQRDGRVGCVILLLADTRHHRRLLAEAGEGLRAAFPVPQRPSLAALRAGKSPPGNALILL